MAGRHGAINDNKIPWQPGVESSALFLDRLKWEQMCNRKGLGTPENIRLSAEYHIICTTRISDAAIYRMIMKESEQE